MEEIERVTAQPESGYYIPKQALIIYSNNIANRERHREEKYYVEISDISSGRNGQPLLNAGKPLTKGTLEQLMRIVAESDKNTIGTLTNLAPTSLVYLDQRPGFQELAFWTPAGKRPIFRERKKVFEAWVPAMLYMVSGQNFFVFALKSSKRPTFSTQLFHAPFFNVYNDAKVCLGSVKRPKDIQDIQEAVTAWEKAFWNSEFTNTVTGAYSEKQLNSWWRAKKRKKFNVKNLKANTRFKTLHSLCKIK